MNAPEGTGTVASERTPGWRQSLASGAAGVALLHVERARTGTGSWHAAHAWIREATGEPISAAEHASLYVGAPAVAFVLHLAGRYRSALSTLDGHVADLVHRRVTRAEARIDHGGLPGFGEYDLLGGLTGIGAHLLAHAPGSDALGKILTYLVRLTDPVRTGDGPLPGWWTHHDPSLGHSRRFDGGHSNFGVAHGIAGPLALLAQAARQGITVDRHHEAIHTITTWFDTWQRCTEAGTYWPQWISRTELHAGRSHQDGPLRPSWCYGTPGIARALQLAALALADPARQHAAEDALLRCVTDPTQLNRIDDASLCHGWAGLYTTVRHAAPEARTTALRTALPALADALTRHATLVNGPGLLEGATGVALAMETAGTTRRAGGWDTCLLIN